MIYDMLYPYQKHIIDKFKDKQSFGLFLDMGLGKTPLSLAFAETNKCNKVIVVTINAKACEGDISGSWLNWAKKCNIDYSFLNKNSSLSEIDADKNQLLIINYESLFSRTKTAAVAISLKDILAEFLMSCRGKNVALIVDESHKIKNLQSKQTKAIMMAQKLLRAYGCNLYTYLLTGTPFTTGYIDLYTQLKVLGYTSSKGHFVDMYCVKGNIAGLYEWQQPIVGYKNVAQLFDLVHKYALTVKSEDVIDLPDKIFVDHCLDKSKMFNLYTFEKYKAFDILDELSNRNAEFDRAKYIKNIMVNNPFYRNIAYPSFDWIADTNGSFWLRARQISIGFQGNAECFEWYDTSRLDALRMFLENNENNYIIFYNFTPELIEIFNICDELGYNIDVYCGEIKNLSNYEKFSQLSDEEKLVTKKNVIIANFASGSTGMNWQEYNQCIIFSMPLYKDYAQAVKRIHRVGQKDICFYHVFYSNNWLDNGMKQALEQQTDYTDKMFMDDLARIRQFIEEEE